MVLQSLFLYIFSVMLFSLSSRHSEYFISINSLLPHLSVLGTCREQWQEKPPWAREAVSLLEEPLSPVCTWAPHCLIHPLRRLTVLSWPFPGSLCVRAYTCVWWCAYVYGTCTWGCLCVSVCGRQRSTSNVFLDCLPPYLLRQDLTEPRDDQFS